MGITTSRHKCRGGLSGPSPTRYSTLVARPACDCVTRWIRNSLTKAGHLILLMRPRSSPSNQYQLSGCSSVPSHARMWVATVGDNDHG